ncbi:phage tail assembly protein [Serratia marcescens]|uniref:phage tail assembly protein n=1 Tax=Serratia marcescens TaxID=615 RepID=UPI0007C91F5C|nr:phage tail assembly protein [Serratia marcescens]OAH27054.1 phage tail protein [Serratia marcescens]
MKQIPLSKPIMAHNEKLYVLELQEPTYDQVAKFGMPFSLTVSGEVKLDSAAAMAYIPELAGIPISSARQLALSDIFLISMSILGFFTASKTQQNSEKGSTTQPTSGD